MNHTATIVMSFFDLHKIISYFQKTDKNIEVEVEDVIEFLENIQEENNINYNFYLEQLDIKTDIIITLKEGFSPFILEIKLELKDANYVCIYTDNILLYKLYILKHFF